MNTKKFIVFFMAIAFIIVVLFSVAGIMTVQEIDVDYKVLSYSTNGEDKINQTTENVQNLLDEFMGSNLLFLDVRKVENALKVHPRLDVLSIEKKFPNVINIQIQERREVYSFSDGSGKEYILNEQGYILSDSGEQNQNINIIELSFDNVTVLPTSVGEKLKIENDVYGQIMDNIFDISQKVGLADCIDSIRIKDYTNGYDVFFKTHTGVEIHIVDMNIDGEKKTKKAFEIYDTMASDYQKRFGQIWSLYVGTLNGEVVEWDAFKIFHTYQGNVNTNDTPMYEEKLNN